MMSVAMRRKLFFLGSLLVLAVGVALLVKTLNNRGPKVGELRVECQPTASIFLDNKHLGRTPYRDKVEAGEYVIKIVPESAVGQLSGWEGKITVGTNLLTYVNASLAESELNSAVDLLSLQKISGKNPELSVVTNPDGATITVDDATKGVTPLVLSDLAIGDHAVVINSPGFLTRPLKIKLTPGYKLAVMVKLALSTGALLSEATQSATPSGTIKPTGTVKPTPAGAKTPTPTPPDPPKPFVIIKDTPTGFLRVRMEPSTAATESARVKPGEKYHLLDTRSGWYEISYDNLNKGWISGTYAEKVE